MLQPHGPPIPRDAAHRVLADDKVRCTGEPLAIVVAESRALAEDACELVDVDIDPLPAVVDDRDALDPDGAPLFEELGTNIVYHRADTYGDVDAAFAQAHVVVSETFTQERMANVPMEGRAILADFRRDTDELMIDVAHQNPHALRGFGGCRCSTIRADLVTVRCGDIGGSFGQKAYTSREELRAVRRGTHARPSGEVDRRSHREPARGRATRATTSSRSSSR